MSKKLIFSIITALLLLSVGIIPDLILNSTAKVQTITPQLKPMTTYVYTTGKIKPASTKEIYLSAPVYPTNINVSVGDYVNNGDLLAEIDVETTLNILTTATPIEAQFTQITELVAKLPDPSILYAMGKAYGLSKQDIDNFYNTAKYTETNSKVYYIPEVIISAFSGVVTQIGIEDNVLNYPDKPAFIVSDINNLIAVMDVAQKDVEQIKVGMHCTVNSGEVYAEGIVTAIAPIAKESLGGASTVEVEVTLESNQNLKAGYSVEGKILINDEIMSYALPMEAINQDENNSEYVYVYKNNMPVKVPVKIALEDAEGVLITEGLTEDDIVLINSHTIEKNKLVVITED